MDSFPIAGADDIQSMRMLIGSLSANSTVVDFEELMLLPGVRETARIWRHDDQTIGFAYVDDYNNLWFDCIPAHNMLEKMETEIIEWGIACIKKQHAEETSLDSTCNADNHHRIEVLARHGFQQQRVHTIHYSRSLSTPIADHPLPDGYSIRSVSGEDEVEALVTLHRAAFQTDNMTIERRLALMRAPLYEKDLDLVVVAPNGELAAFCVCGFNDAGRQTGYTDPVGTHNRYQNRGLGKAVISAGFRILKNMGANVVELSTSSENLAMQKLADVLGFGCVSEKLWFSKEIS